MRRLILALACGALIALPALAQQPGGDPNVLDRIDSAVRGFLNRLFGGGESKPGQARTRPDLETKARGGRASRATCGRTGPVNGPGAGGGI